MAAAASFQCPCELHHDTTGPDFGKNIGLDVLKIPGTNGSDPRQSGFPINGRLRPVLPPIRKL